MKKPSDEIGDLREFLSDAEALEQQPLPRVARGTLYLLVAMIAAAVLWASLSEIDRIVIARGKLVTLTPNIVVQPLESSIIRSIDVQVGQLVRKGEPLATFDATFAGSDVVQVRSRFASLQAQVKRIEAELGGASSFPVDPAEPEEALQHNILQERRATYEFKVRALDEAISRLQGSIAGNQQDQALLRDRRQTTAQIEQMQESLGESKFGSKLDILASHNARLQVEQDLQRATNLAQELQRDLARAEAERAGFEKEWRQRLMEDLVQTKRERDALLSQVTKAERLNELQVMTSPSDAVVLEIAKRSVGSVLREAEPLITLVPLDAGLEAEVQIDAKDISYVRAGDPARIKFDAFPFQKHGVVDARLKTVSEDAFARDAASVAGSRAAPEAFYLARLTLGAITLKEVPPDVKLIPGMTLTAEIVFGKRSVISYFLYPIIRSLDESLREP
jgi:HlyD family secretion protein